MEKDKTIKTKKEKPVKKVIEKKPIQLISYTMRMVIPTMQYGNVQPEITIYAETLKEATDVLYPHVEELYRKYAEIKPKFLQVAPIVTVKENMPPVPKNESKVDTSGKEVHTSDYDKALAVIESAQSVEALNLLSTKLQASEKHSPENKNKLMVILINKIKAVNAK